MNTDAKGAIIGFGDVHTRAHIYRSILEGLGYALKDSMLALEKKNKVKIKCLGISGPVKTTYGSSRPSTGNRFLPTILRKKRYAHIPQSSILYE